MPQSSIIVIFPLADKNFGAWKSMKRGTAVLAIIALKLKVAGRSFRTNV